MNLRFALITDMHFGPEARFEGKLRKLSAQAAALTRAFVERMNDEVHPDLVVNLGDNIEDESPEDDRERYGECMAILRELRAEVRHVAGNHDVVHLTREDLLELWGRPEQKRLFTSFDLGGAHFTVLNTRERKDLDVSVGEEQLEWLSRDLASTSLPTIVLMHHSAADQDLAGNRWFEGSPNICLVRERAAIRAALAKQGRVLAVFNGHLHWNHLDVIDGIPYVTLQSLIENLDDDAPGRPAAAHAVVRVNDERMVVEIHGGEQARYQFERRF